MESCESKELDHPAPKKKPEMMKRKKPRYMAHMEPVSYSALVAAVHVPMALYAGDREIVANDAYRRHPETTQIDVDGQSVRWGAIPVPRRVRVDRESVAVFSAPTNDAPVWSPYDDVKKEPRRTTSKKKTKNLDKLADEATKTQPPLKKSRSGRPVKPATKHLRD